MKKLLTNIYWYFYKMTNKGKRQHTLLQGFKGFQQSNKEANIAKWDIINAASKKLKTKKIVAFLKGKSISQPKKTNHQVIEVSRNENKEVLQKNHLKINNRGQFKTA